MLSTILMTVLMGQGAAVAPKSVEPVKPTLVPDVHHVAKEGDILTAYSRDARGVLQPVLAPTSPAAVYDLVDFQRAGDATGLRRLVEQERAITLEPGTRLRVLSLWETAIRRDKYLDVRVEGGPLDGKRAYVLADQVALCRVVIPPATKKGGRRTTTAQRTR